MKSRIITKTFQDPKTLKILKCKIKVKISFQAFLGKKRHYCIDIFLIDNEFNKDFVYKEEGWIYAINTLILTTDETTDYKVNLTIEGIKKEMKFLHNTPVSKNIEDGNSYYGLYGKE